MKTATNLNGNNLALWLTTATEIRMADLYTITPKVASVLRLTTWDTNLTVSGNTFLTGPPHLKRSHIEEKCGLDVTSLDMEIGASTTDLFDGVPILQALAMGLFEGATVRIDRLFMDSSGNQIGTVTRFSGFIGAIDEIGRTYAKFQVDALVSILQQQVPRNVLQPNCVHTLFDAGCTLSKAAFQESNTVQAGSTVNKIISLSAKADGYYDNGQIVFTSGANNGLTKAVKSYASQQFFFNSPLPFAPSGGDTFLAYPGDDKTQATCTNKFSNLANFLGFPYVPPPETAI